MTNTRSEMWLDGSGWPREPPAQEQWALWGVQLTTFLPILAQLLAGSVPRWYGWVLIGVFVLALLRYAAKQLSHAGAVVDAMPLDPPALPR